MLSLPDPQVLDFELRISGPHSFRRDVYDRQWHYQVRDGEITQAQLLCREVAGRIDVGSGVLDQFDAVHQHTCRCARAHCRLHRYAGMGRVEVELARQTMGQVDDFQPLPSQPD